MQRHAEQHTPFWVKTKGSGHMPQIQKPKIMPKSCCVAFLHHITKKPRVTIFCTLQKLNCPKNAPFTALIRLMNTDKA